MIIEFGTPTEKIFIDSDNPDPIKLEQVGLTRQQFEDMFNKDQNWSNFRHDLKGSDIFPVVVASGSVTALMGAYFMDSLREKDYEDLIAACALIDSVLSFSQEQKDEVNTMASNNYLPGPIFS